MAPVGMWISLETLGRPFGGRWADANLFCIRVGGGNKHSYLDGMNAYQGEKNIASK